MRYIIALLLVSMLLFGCFGIGEPPKETANETKNTTTQPEEKKNPVVIIEERNTSIGSGTGARNETNNSGGGNITKPPKTGANYTYTPNDVFAVYFILVGDNEVQGDAIFIKKGDLDVLIDAGPQKNADKVVNFLKGKGIDDIDVLISTHADSEHHGGISAILDNFDVEEFWWSGRAYDDTEYSALIDRVREEGIPTRTVARGDNFDLNGLNFRIMNPKLGGAGDADNGAVAIKVTQQRFCILLTSDILVSAQNEIVNFENAKCDILQLPYHALGRGTAQSDLFVINVDPKIAVVSGGSADPVVDRRPSRFTIFEKLNLRHVPYYENYKNGTIRITSDGGSYVLDFVK